MMTKMQNPPFDGGREDFSGNRAGLIRLNSRAEVISWDPFWEILLGYTPEESVKKSLWEILPQSCSSWQELWPQVLRGETFSNLTFNLYQNNEVTHHLNICLVPEFTDRRVIRNVMVVLNDQTEAYFRQTETDKEKTKLETLFKYSPAAIAMGNLHDGLIYDANEDFLNFFNYPRTDLLSKTVFELEIWYDINDRSYIINTLKEHHEIINFETRFRTRDGVKYALLTMKELAAGDLSLVMVMIVDITEKKKNERSSNLHQGQIQQAKRMEMTGRMIRSLGSDLRDFFVPIHSIAESGLKKDRDLRAMKQSLEQIKNNMGAAGELLDQMSDFDSDSDNILQPINLSTELGKSRSILRGLLRDDIEMSLCFRSQMSLIKGNRTRLHHCWLNLILYVNEILSTGGRLLICVDRKFFPIGDKPENVPRVILEINLQSNNSRTDEGDRNNITETAEPAGVTIARQSLLSSVQAMNAEMETESACIFTIKIPPGDFNIKDSSIDNTGRESILVVEDEPQILEMLEKQLISVGYNVLTASNSAEALGKMEKFEGKISLLLTDVVLPRMSGPDLYDRVQILSPGTKVLYLSGYDHQIVARHGVVEGAASFLSKPFTLSELISSVRKALGGQQFAFV